MKVKLTYKGDGTAVQRTKQKHGQGVGAHPIQVYVSEGMEAQLNQLAMATKRSVSSLANEMLLFALQSLADGETELEQVPSNMHPPTAHDPVAGYDLSPAKRNNGGTGNLRFSPVTSPLSFKDAANKTLNTNLKDWHEPAQRLHMDKQGNIWGEAEE